MNEELKQLFSINKHNFLKIYYENIQKPLIKQFYTNFILNNEIREYLIEFLEGIYLDQNNVIYLKDGSLLTWKYLFDEVYQKFFSAFLEYLCSNPSCSNSENKYCVISPIKTCPKCKSPIELLNLDKLEFGLKFILSSYEFYNLDGEKNTTYIILDKNLNNMIIKAGDSSFKDFLLLRITNNHINRKDDKKELLINYNFLKLYGNNSFDNLLLNFVKEHCSIKNVWHINFKPVKEKLFYEDQLLYINKYKGNKYLNLEREDHKYNIEKHCPNINFLLNNLTGNDSKGKEYLIKYLAFILQNPHIRTQKMILLAGDQGAGKGRFKDLILRPLFEKYISDINGLALDRPYNSFLKNCIVLWIDEIQYKKEHINPLKNWITEDYVYISNKYGTEETTKIYCNLIVTSNENKPIGINGRRLVYFRSKVLGGSNDKAQVIGEKLTKKIPLELDIFATILKSIDIDFDYINKGYDTQAKRDLEESLLSLEDQFIRELNEYEDISLFGSYYSQEYSYDSEYSKLNNIGNYMHNDFLIIDYFLDCYNVFRHNKGLKKVNLASFSIWFYEKMNVNRDDKSQYKRGKINNKNVHLVNIDLFKYKLKQKQIIQEVK